MILSLKIDKIKMDHFIHFESFSGEEFWISIKHEDESINPMPLFLQDYSTEEVLAIRNLCNSFLEQNKHKNGPRNVSGK